MTEMIDSFTVRPKLQTQLTIFRSTERQGTTALRSHISRRHAQIHQRAKGALGGGQRQVVRGTHLARARSKTTSARSLLTCRDM